MEYRKRHERSHFYKYVSSDTAKIILLKNSIKANCPLKFNDPFDVQIGLHHGFDINKLPEYFFDRSEALVESAENPVFESETEFSKAIMYMRTMKPSPSVFG